MIVLNVIMHFPQKHRELSPLKINAIINKYTLGYHEQKSYNYSGQFLDSTEILSILRVLEWDVQLRVSQF